MSIEVSASEYEAWRKAGGANENSRGSILQKNRNQNCDFNGELGWMISIM